jgi:hypothetical protein
MERLMNLYEVLEYGAIVHHDQDLGILITANGAYLNWWNGSMETGWENSECRSFDIANGNGIMSLALHDVMDRAEKWVQEEISWAY